VTLKQVLCQLGEHDLCDRFGQTGAASSWIQRLSAEELDQPAELLPARAKHGWPARVKVWGTGRREGTRYWKPALLREGDDGILFTSIGL
jgi:hypothetical protein